VVPVNAKLISQYLNKLPGRTRSILLICLFGLAAGLVAVAFHLTILFIFEQTFVRFQSMALKADSMTPFLIGSFVTIMSTSLLAGYLLNSFCTDAKGSGIPQLKLAFWKDSGYMPWRVVWVKFIAGALSVGGGCSLGREGPSVHIAGGLASNLAGVMGKAKRGRRDASAAGAAAGLAAAFNTPLAAVTFVLEEIVGDLNSRFLGSVLLASVIGALVVHGILGEEQALTIGKVPDLQWRVYLLIPVVAAAASLVGVLFQKWTLKLRRRRKTFQHVPTWARPAIGGFMTWVIGCSVFVYTGRLGVFGLGYQDLTEGLTDPAGLGWKIAGVLLVAKFTATYVCYGFGGCGGIFSPMLFLGGMCGVFLAGLCNEIVPLEQADHVMLAVVGMSACLGAVVGAPVTCILIVFEMTHEFALVPALMLGMLVSQAISRRLLKGNFYEGILKQDGHNLEHVIPPRDLRTWHQLPVSSIATFQPVVLRSLEAEEVSKVLEAYPYHYFPVVLDGKLTGVLSRMKGETAVREKTEPILQPAVACLPTESIKDLQNLLIESPTGVVMVWDQVDGNVIGLVTLHDLLRREVAASENAA
jgi:CIC family chloride channel protein